MSKKVIAIIGPTGMGKTDLALTLFKQYHLPVISVDAFQIYIEMNIGVNKPKPSEIMSVPYYGINLVHVNNNYSIYDFQKYARQLINDSPTPVILVGGSMLYLDSVIYDYTLPADFDNSNHYEGHTDIEIYQELLVLDPIACQKIDPNNRKRLITALNYYLQYHQSIFTNNNKEVLYYDALFIYLKPENKDELNQKNAQRIQHMFAEGWKQEVALILHDYPAFITYNAAKAIGYSEIAAAIMNGSDDVDITKIEHRTNLYVKHQLSWYKRYEDHCLVIHSPSEFCKIKEQVDHFLHD